jgi:segregation and condensation protein B
MPDDAASSTESADLTMPQVLSAIESVLFVAGRALEIGDLRKLLGVDDGDLHAALALLGTTYEREGRGVRLQHAGGQVQLVSAPENARFVAALLGMPTHARLTTAALETLAIIAYRQPITRAQLETIRGVNSDRALATLAQHGLVMEVGRANTVGRPILFGTTLEFLQQFGLSGLDALPTIDLAEAEQRATDARAIRAAVASTDIQQENESKHESHETSTKTTKDDRDHLQK